jgi:hypothetical protein
MRNCEGEKPRTTVVREGISGEGWDSVSEGMSDSLEGDWDSVVVDPERWMVAGDGRVADLRCSEEEVGAERGALSLTMDMIIFSKSSELM